MGEIKDMEITHLSPIQLPLLWDPAVPRGTWGVLAQENIPSGYHYQPVWVMAVIVLSVMIIGYLFSAYHSRFMDVFKTPFTSRGSQDLSREDNFLSNPVSILLSVNFLFTGALFFLQCGNDFFGSIHIEYSFPFFLLVIGILMVVYLVKMIILKMIGFVFDMQGAANEYLGIIFLVNQLAGIAFIPVIIFNAYGNQWAGTWISYAGVIMLAFGFILRIWRGATSIFSTGRASLFYIFLYLCTLEILPLIFGLKLIEKVA